jgi:beta-catenin-like protein 1
MLVSVPTLLLPPDEIYKSAKLTSNDHGSRHVRIEEDDAIEAGPARPPVDGGDGDGDGEEDAGEYGPAAPPGGEDEDEEGRFFGGGITAQESEILDFVDSNPAAAANDEKMDMAWLKKRALGLEKRISRNAELRAKFEDDPAKFIDSEAELDADIKALSILGEHPELYPEFARLGSVASLVGLLAHENTDIAIDAIEIVGELTGEDVAATEEQWGVLVDALLEADLLGLLISNFARLDEEQEADRSGVYFALSVLENLCSRAETARTIGKEDGLLKWLLGRIQKAEKPIGQNKQYAAEILAILAQASTANRRRLVALDAVDLILQLVAAYRKRDPEKGSEEEEFVEDLFEALTCLVDEPEGKAKFVEAEGVELCLIMLKEGKMSKAPALRLLDHSCGGSGGAEVCRKLVEAGGLKTIFTVFIKKHDNQSTEHLVAIFSWMLRLLPADSPERIRMLAKFMEKAYEKTEKLVKLRREYASKVGALEEQIREEGRNMSDEDKEEMADEWFSRRLDAGLFCLQTIDVILAWLIAEDDGARKKIRNLLADRDETFIVIKTTIREQIEGIDDGTDGGKETKDMLSTLVEFLE